MEALSLPNLPTLWFKAVLKIATGLCSQAWRPAGKKQTAFILLPGRHSLPSPRVPAPGLGLIVSSSCDVLPSILAYPIFHPVSKPSSNTTFPDLPPLSSPNGLSTTPPSLLLYFCSKSYHSLPWMTRVYFHVRRPYNRPEAPWGPLRADLNEWRMTGVKVS